MEPSYSELPIDGYTTRLVRTGRGKPVVLLPSPLVMSPFYLPLAGKLSEQFDVTLVELPGSARGPRLRHPWTFERYGQWVVKLLEELNVGPVALVTHSNSGPIGMWTAVIAPHRVSALVLGDGTGGDTSGSLARVIFGRAVDCFVEISLTMSNWQYVLYPCVFHARNFFNQVRLSKCDLFNLASQVRTPTLLAWGCRDWTMPLPCAQRLRRVMPCASLYTSARGSHDWIIERVSEFAHVVSDFVNGNASVGGRICSEHLIA